MKVSASRGFKGPYAWTFLLSYVHREASSSIEVAPNLEKWPSNPDSLAIPLLEEAAKME